MNSSICLKADESCIEYILSGKMFKTSGVVPALKLGQKFILVGEYSKRILEMQVVNIKYIPRFKPEITAFLWRVSTQKK